MFDDLTCLLESAGFDPRPAEPGKARFYAVNRQLVDDKGLQLLALKSGGSNPHPHVECYGSPAAIVGGYLREFYQHQPTRIDHAVDRRAPGLFDRIHAYAVDLCKRHGLRGAPAGDWVTPDGGRTFYIGSRSSQVFVRAYEKGIKYCRDLGQPIDQEHREWVRVELEFKPQTKVAKGLAAKIDGAQMWGSTSWTDQLASEILDMNAQPVNIRERRESNHERALRFMASQYKSHLRKLFDDQKKDFCEFGKAIGNLAGFDEAQD